MNMNSNEKIFVEERRQQILDLVNQRNRVNVTELSQLFNIGEVTVRRDLSELEARGLIRRTHGGALPAENASHEAPIKERELRYKEQKERIASFVAQLIRNGETIMLDGGTTTLQIARHLKGKNNLMIVTNSIGIAQELDGSYDCEVILTGGQFKHTTQIMAGPIAEKNLKLFRADRVILGMSAIHTEQGLFTVNLQEAELKRAMIQCGKEVIVAMDSSKFEKLTFSFVSDFSSIDKIITDNGVTDEIIKRLEEFGVEVIVV
jgi:DeoR family fructose operon transcriptional repressor